MKAYLVLSCFTILPLIMTIFLVKWILNDYIDKKVNEKIKQMKYLILFIPVFGFSQIPDTIYYAPFTYTGEETTGTSDSQLYILFEAKTLPNTLLKLPQPIDKAMTRTEIAEYVFNLVYRYENLNWLDEARIQQRQKSNSLMQPINKIMQDFTGVGYFPNARQKFIAGLQGVYIVRNPNRTTEYFLIRQNATIVECTEDGTAIIGGKTGSIQILTENRFRITSYFGAEAGTATFNKELDTPFFFSNQAQVRIRKIK
jgi:hypothetical protein